MTGPPLRRLRNPWWFVPSLYFVEGFPYTIVNLVSVPCLKSLGASNELIGLTSFMYLPWAIKLLWSPLVEGHFSKRGWILITQFGLGALLVALAVSFLLPFPIALAMVVFIPIAFVSATHDVATDGFYLELLDSRQQAFFVGIRSTAYKVAWLSGTGGLVYLAGTIQIWTGSIQTGWFVSMGLGAVVLFLLGWFHFFILPRSNLPGSTKNSSTGFFRIFGEAFINYFSQGKILPIIGFILFYRLGDALMLKMAQPFLMDSIDSGGLGLGIDVIGIIYGTVGTIFSIIGGIVGGLLVSRIGLKRCIWPLALIQNMFILLYWMLAIYQPGVIWVAGVNAFEQFAYGLGVSAYTVFLMQTVKAEYKATQYAIATSFMALGIMLPGAISGYLVSAMGYMHFFLLCFGLSLPGMLLLFFIPYRREEALGG